MMRRNNSRFNPRQYEEHLSPFGRQVLGTLIKQWNFSDRNRNNMASNSASLQFHQPTHQPHRYSNSHRRVITFDDSSKIRGNNSQCNPVLQTNSNNDHQFTFPCLDNSMRCSAPVVTNATAASATSTACILTVPPAFLTPVVEPVTSEPLTCPVLTSAELVTASSIDQDKIRISEQGNTIKDNIINKTRHDLDMVEDYMTSEPKLDEALIEARTVLEQCQIGNNVDWDDMFDTELFSEIDSPVDKTVKAVNNDKICDIQFLKSSNIQTEIDNTHKETKGGTDKKKRKNQTKVTDVMTKKVKKNNSESKLKSKTISKSSARNKSFTENFESWLNDLDPNNPVDELQEPLELHDSNKTKENIDVKITVQKEKKVIQTQLANKDGIMKFGKPKNFVVNPREEIEIETTENKLKDKNKMKVKSTETVDEITKKERKTKAIENKSKDKKKVQSSKNTEECSKAETKTKYEENKLKDKDQMKQKKSKPKFIAPVKSQIPVKDITYNIHELNDGIINKLNLDKIKEQEIVVLLLYSKGFSQLNSQHTEDACVPEAVMFQLDDNFFYLQGGCCDFTELLSKILQNNTIICYEGKALLNYLSSKMKLEFDTLCEFSIIDVKIAGSLLEPDDPPETFSALQHLTGSEPDYTIATTCERQKAAWYATLLRSAAAAVRTRLQREELWQVFVDIEMQILPIIADMEQHGVCVDVDKLKEMEKILLAKMKEVESECAKAAGRSFQINSTVQVRALLYDELKLDEKAGLKVRGTLSTGAKSTSETMLKSLVSLHPLPRLILEYRRLHKAHATFLQGVAQYTREGIVRPVWVQTAAATGRIACSNPNLQAIPKVPFSLTPAESGASTECGALRLRSVYVARPWHVVVAADWRHVECRVFARAAADTALQRALAAPDLFRTLAADWLQKGEQEVTPADRERTKRIVYASLYGAGPRKLMDILHVDYPQALTIAASFDSTVTRTFPMLRGFGRVVAARCRAAGGRVWSLCGRTRLLPRINSDDPTQRAHAERQALNFIVQGSAADVCKLAMARAVRGVRARGLRARLLLQIHDELVWEVHRGDLPQAAEVIRCAMEQCGDAAGLPPLPVALAAGRSWGELEPYPSADGQDDLDLWDSLPLFDF